LPNAKSADSDVIKQLTEIQRQWGEGELKKDRAIYDRVCADDYIQGTRTGQVLKKEEWLKGITKPGVQGLTEYHTDTMDVQVLGNGTVALETVQVTIAGRDEQGTPWRTTIRALRVFEKQKGQWRALQTQFSPPLQNPEPATAHID